MNMLLLLLVFFFFNDTATTEIYTLSLHDALPISRVAIDVGVGVAKDVRRQKQLLLARIKRTKPNVVTRNAIVFCAADEPRSEEHTSELQSPCNLVCRLLLEKKKVIKHPWIASIDS